MCSTACCRALQRTTLASICDPASAAWPRFANGPPIADATGRRLAAAVHIDTGINRLGMPPSEVDALAAEPGLLRGVDSALVMSHLACADEPTHPMNALQRKRFDELRAKLPPAPASLANSGGVFLGPDYHYDLVRPGIALYGGRALAGHAPIPCSAVVRLQARILQVREMAPGRADRLRRNLPRTERHSRIATLACGYADGFLRALSGAIGQAGTGRLHRRLSRAGRRPRVDGPDHGRRHRCAARAGAARRLGRSDGRSASRSTT